MVVLLTHIVNGNVSIKMITIIPRRKISRVLFAYFRCIACCWWWCWYCWCCCCSGKQFQSLLMGENRKEVCNDNDWNSKEKSNFVTSRTTRLLVACDKKKKSWSKITATNQMQTRRKLNEFSRKLGMNYIQKEGDNSKCGT